MEDHTSAKRALDRLRREATILFEMEDSILYRSPHAEAVHIVLTLQQAKRVRSASNLFVRAVARERDQLQSQEDTSE